MLALIVAQSLCFSPEPILGIRLEQMGIDSIFCGLFFSAGAIGFVLASVVIALIGNRTKTWLLVLMSLFI